MNKKNWIIPLVILTLVVLVIVFRDKFIVKEEEIIEADYCEVDGDCVLAVIPSSCCNCPMPINKKVVELDKDYIIYDFGLDYSDYEKEADCSGVACEPCNPSTTLRCINNKCQLINI